MKKKKEICKIDGCNRAVTVFIHQLCHAHYVRLWRTGSPGTGKIKRPKSVKPWRL